MLHTSCVTQVFSQPLCSASLLQLLQEAFKKSTECFISGFWFDKPVGVSLYFVKSTQVIIYSFEDTASQDVKAILIYLEGDHTGETDQFWPTV